MPHTEEGTRLREEEQLSFPSMTTTKQRAGQVGCPLRDFLPLEDFRRLGDYLRLVSYRPLEEGFHRPDNFPRRP